MLNEDLFDPKDRELIRLRIENRRLKEAIQAFKKYDEKRKRHYSSLAVRVGELESYVEELEQGRGVEALKAKNKMYKEQLHILNCRTYVNRFELSDMQVVATATKLQLQEKIKQLTEKVKKQKETINDLLSQLNRTAGESKNM